MPAGNAISRPETLARDSYEGSGIDGNFGSGRTIRLRVLLATNSEVRIKVLSDGMPSKIVILVDK